MLLRKVVYPYEYMDSWEWFHETTLLNKRAFYSELQLEDITDKYYKQPQKVCKYLKMKNPGDYHDFYVQRDHYLLLMYLKILEKDLLKYMIKATKLCLKKGYLVLLIKQNQ